MKVKTICMDTAGCFSIEWGIIMEMSQQETDTQKKVAMKVSRVSIIVNLLLSAGKLLAGIIANSGANDL